MGDSTERTIRKETEMAEAVAYGVAAVVMTAVFYVALELAATAGAWAAAGVRRVARWSRGVIDITVRRSSRPRPGYGGPGGCSSRPRTGAPGAARAGACSLGRLGPRGGGTFMTGHRRPAVRGA
jgi:hypothetical protein